MTKITPFLWFNNQAEEAVDFYVKLFPNSKIKSMARYDEAGAKVSGQKKGSVMTVSFSLDGTDFSALNGGPIYQFSQATSFVIECKNQQEVDHYWNALTKGGQIQPCGWVIDKFGVTWQVVPTALPRLLGDKDPKKAKRVMECMLQMQKLDIAKLQAAYDGK
jgi:predicted 3-demethylubiquinone-9 3-methyltransferase (glyoxalase superfamily)